MKSIYSYITEKLNIKNINVSKDNTVDLDLPSGTLWCKYNVGATNESTAASWYGNYFMWGDIEPADDKNCTWDNYKHANGNYNKLTKYCPTKRSDYWDGTGKPDNVSELDMQDDMANANMTGKYKLPTKEQFEELIKNTTNEWVTNYQDISGLDGMLFTSKTNKNTSLFIPAAGYRNGNYMFNVGSYVGVWSSTLDTEYPDYAYYLLTDGSDILLGSNARYYSFPIRPILLKK